MASQPGLVTLPGTWTGAQYTSSPLPSLSSPLVSLPTTHLIFSPGASVRFARVSNAFSSTSSGRSGEIADPGEDVAPSDKLCHYTL